jgi:hypothetical protein
MASGKLLIRMAARELGGFGKKGAIYRCGSLPAQETMQPRNEFVTVPIYCWDKRLGNCIIFINFAGS